jgi:hypothetical protein
MWDSAPADQAEEYSRRLLDNSRLSDVDKFNMLRGISVTVAGIRANAQARSSKEELERVILSLYHDRLAIDLNIHREGIAAKLTLDIMKKRVLSGGKKLTKRKTEAIERAEAKAIKKNLNVPDADNFTGFECHELFLEIKFESNNTFNPLWVKALNKNGDLPSGVQLPDILDKVRQEAFALKDATRRGHLVTSRKRRAAAIAKAAGGATVAAGAEGTGTGTAAAAAVATGAAGTAVAADENDFEDIDVDFEEGKEEKKVFTNLLLLIHNSQLQPNAYAAYFLFIQDSNKSKKDTPSKVKEMPDDYIPVHFLSWLSYGPASDSQNPLWLPDTGKPVIKVKSDILESSASSDSIGRSSQYSRKAQRQEMAMKSTSKVLDLTQNDEVVTALIKQSVDNSTKITSMISYASNPEKVRLDAIVVNKEKKYAVDKSEKTKQEYLKAIEDQSNFLEIPSSSIVAPVAGVVIPEVVNNHIDDNELDNDVIHNLDNSFTSETT